MTGTSPSEAAASRPSGSLGPGTLVLVVGPSGAGKDAFMAAARALLADETRVMFARRLITRAQGPGERHGTLSEAAFDAGHATRAFPLSWRAHGLGYALGPDTAEAIRAGRLVLANGSRAVVPEAYERFAHLKVVLVTAPAPLRAARLKARGRETDAEIAERLAREPVLATAPDLIIENVNPPEEAGRRLADFVNTALTRDSNP